MAQTLSPQGPQHGRISQILPTVKCSMCGQPVPIADLGDHLCAAPSPAAASAKPPMSPTSPSFFQQKYQKIIASSRPGTPLLSQAPPAATSPVKPPPRLSSATPQQRPAQPTSPLSPQDGPAQRSVSARSPSPAGRVPSPLARTSSTVPLNVAHPARTPSPLSRGTTPDATKVAFPTSPGPPEPAPRVPSPLRHHPSEPTRVATPLVVANRTSSEPARYMGLDSMKAPLVARTPSPGAASILRQQHQQPQVVPSPARAPSNASTRSQQMGVRQPVQSNPAPFQPEHPSRTSTLSASGPQRPRATTNVGNAPHAPAESGSDIIYSTPLRPNPPPMRGPPLNLDTRMAPHTGGPMSPYAQSTSSAARVPSPVDGAMPSMHVEIDTKIGGEAGMAGVGRRGFAAAARAAFFAQQMGMHPAGPQTTLYSSSGTPPLSPGSTVSPRSPYSQQSPTGASIPFPARDGRTSFARSVNGAILRTPSPLEGGGFILRDRVIPPAPEPPKTPLPAPPSTPSMPFFEKFRHKVPTVDAQKSPPPTEVCSPMSPAESEFEGLAYADSTDDEDDKETVAGPSVTPTPETTSRSANRVRFPSMSSKTHSVIKSESKYSSGSSTSAPSPRLPTRSLSASSATTSYTLRSMAKSTGALERAMETLPEEEAPSPTASSVSSPAMFPLALAGSDVQRDSLNRPKLPARAYTTPGMSSGSRPESRAASGKKREKRVRTCLRCEKHIEDGRWIQTEGGGVMCDRCWKNMYLPKCRRCNGSIEKHAVSSSDGQLKGKYHRDCFNCHACHQPFPDKTFYVFDGKPFCAYHYHEVNNSLCAATTCGQPIEGPCAVSHTGDRYHPEHLLCDHPRCTERLVDYWEVDGRMYCDKHAQGFDEDEEEDFPVPRLENQRDSFLRATKRKTRFIDLTGNIPGT